MHTHRAYDGLLRAAIETGTVAAAATAGVLARFGMAAGEGMAGPFAALGRMVLGVTASDGPWVQRTATIAGLVAHCLLVIVWATLFVLVAGQWRGVRLWAAAALFGLVAWAVSDTLLPPVLRLGHGARAFPPQIALLYVVLSLALGAGMRVAQMSRRQEQ